MKTLRCFIWRFLLLIKTVIGSFGYFSMSVGSWLSINSNFFSQTILSVQSNVKNDAVAVSASDNVEN